MDNTTCTTIVLVLLWLSICCQAVGFLVAWIDAVNNIALPTITTLSTILLGVCLWQCHWAGYLVSPMTLYHWVLLVLLIVLQVVAVILQQREQKDFNLFEFLLGGETYPIYGIAVVLLVLLAILGGTLFCGWKCNLFCRPCCKSQYICYGSAIVVVLVILTVLALTAALLRYNTEKYINEGQTDLLIISHLDKILVPCSQCYTTAIIWTTLLKLPYTIPEVVALLASAIAVASILTLAVPGSSQYYGGLSNTTAYPLLAIHLVAMGITWYCLEYKRIFYWPKEYLCLGLLAAVVILVALVVVVIQNGIAKHSAPIKCTLLGYSFLLMVPTLWYAYRCGLFTWRWTPCIPKKNSLKATDTAENTTATKIAKE